MNNATLRLVLTLSVLFNLGVLGALGWQQLTEHAGPASEEPLLVRELQLSEEQQQRWQQLEAPFLIELQHSSAAIRHQRNRLIDSLFAAPLDDKRIRSEQQTLASRQQQQQQLVIDQLLREREILDEHQRQRLAQLLTEQPAPAPDVEVLHSR